MLLDEVACSLCVALAAVWFAAPSAAANAQPAFSYQSPFHAAECGRALDFAQQHADSPRARLIRAEGLLCRGLQEDLTALDAAIVDLRTIVAEEPANFFARLDLADALRKRFPLSDAAEAQLRSVRALLDRSDVGAGRAALTAYIDENLAAVIEYRARLLSLLAHSRAAFAAGTLPGGQIPGFVDLLALTGPDGLVEAEQIRLNQAKGMSTRAESPVVGGSAPNAERRKPL